MDRQADRPAVHGDEEAHAILQAMPITGSSTTRHGRNHRTIIQLPTCMIVEHQSGSGCNKLTYLEPHIHVS